MSIKKQYIPAPLASAVKNGYVTDASEILDENKGKRQDEINQETDSKISDIKGGSTKSIAELSEDIANEAERASGVEAGLRESIDELGQIGLDPDNAISTDGDDFDGDTTAKRSKIPTIGAIIDGNPGVYDVSKRNPTGGPNSDGKFTLEYILANADTLIPTSWRHGGMSISFVSSVDNKYVQYRYMGTAVTGSPNPFLDTANWQGVDDEPTAGSENLVKSGGIKIAIQKLADCIYTEVTDTNGVKYPFAVCDKNGNIGIGLTENGELKFFESAKQFGEKLSANKAFAFLSGYYRSSLVFDGVADKNGNIAMYFDDKGIHFSVIVGHSINKDYPFAIIDNNGNISFALDKEGKGIFYPSDAFISIIKNALSLLPNTKSIIDNDKLIPVSSAVYKAVYPIHVWAPKYVYALEGTTVELFKNSIAVIKDSNAMELRFSDLVNVENSQDYGINYDYSYVYNTVTNLHNFGFRLGLYDSKLNKEYNSPQVTTIVNVKKGSSPSSIKNILCIGDSFTDAGIWVSELRRLLTGHISEGTDDGYSDVADSAIISDYLTNLNFIGTKDTDIRKTPNEGWSGQHYRFFAGGGSDTTQSPSPFVNPSTNSIDFDYYLGTGNVKGSIQDPTSTDKIDYAIILLGTNRNYQEEYVRAIWDGLLTHNPNIKVIIAGRCMPVECGIKSNLYYKQTYCKLAALTFECNSFMESMCEKEEYSENFLYVDYNIRMDILNNMPLDIVQANIRNSSDYAKIKRGQDNVHPKKEGYFQIADAFRGACHYWFLNSNNN